MAFENWPYSDFHDLNLDWVLNKTKEAAAKSDTALTNATDALNYAKTYFDNADFTEQVNAVLERMAGDGTLAALINEQLLGDISSRVNELAQDVDNATAAVSVLTDSARVYFLGGGTTAETVLGNCMVVNVGGKWGIIDFGQRDIPTAIMSFCGNMGITKFDFAIISHYHSDHIGGEAAAGLMYLLNNTSYLTGTTFYLPHNLMIWQSMVGDFTIVRNAETVIKQALASRGNPVIYPTEGQTLTFGNATLTFNNLLASYFNVYYTNFIGYLGNNTGSTNYNNFSMCVTIKQGNSIFVETGDLANAGQRLNAGLFINADVIQIPHHGLEREIPQMVLSNLRAKLGVICGSTFYDHLQMATPFVTQISLMGGSLYYTSGQPWLCATLMHNDIELTPITAELYNFPATPMTIGGGVAVPYVAPSDNASIANEDFNKLTNPCELLFLNKSVFERWKNRPTVSSSGGKTIVMKSTASNTVRQFYIYANPADANLVMSTRFGSGSVSQGVWTWTWSAWTHIKGTAT